MSKLVTKAVIPAAGMGTRFLPATKTIPKEMIPILSTPTIDVIVQEAVEAGIEEILIVTSHIKHSLSEYFRPNKHLEKYL
jgi:UTP--glucose-1-phosphate uridylyltransferase